MTEPLAAKLRRMKQAARAPMRGQDDAGAIGRIAHEIAETEDPLSVIQAVAEAAMRLVGASGAYFERFAINHDDVEIIAAVGSAVPAVGTSVPYPGSLTEDPIIQDGRLVIPLRHGAEVLGVLVVLRKQEDVAFTRDDVERLQLLTDLTSIVLKQARLLDEFTERQRSQDAVALLSEIGARLAAATDYAETVRIVAETVTSSFADYCIIDVAAVGGGHFERVGYAHRNPEHYALLAASSAYPAAATGRIAEPFRTGEPLLIERVSEEDVRSVSQSDDHRRIVNQLGPRSYIVVPLLARGHRLGLMLLVRTDASGRRYEKADIDLALELGRRAGSAIEKARLQAEAERAVRARDEVLGVVAHDLRNPVHTIAMSASILEELQLNEEDRRKQIAIIKRSTQRANRLIGDLLDVTKIEAGALALLRKEVDVNELLHEVCDLFGLLAGQRRFDFDCHVDEELPCLDADRDRLMQVFTNLLGNAIKFTSEGARIRVRARRQKDTVEFAISDAGIGIAPDQLPNLFNRFWQAKRGKEGAGLGLAIVKGIVEAHSGTVSVESEVGRGTTFTFTLPIAASSSPKHVP